MDLACVIFINSEAAYVYAMYHSLSIPTRIYETRYLAIELQTNPGASGYIIVYSGRTSRPGTASRLGARAQSYLVTVRGIDMNHLVIIDGGYRERDYFELYFVPQGAAPPQPTPTVRPNDARPTKSTQPRRSRQR